LPADYVLKIQQGFDERAGLIWRPRWIKM